MPVELTLEESKFLRSILKEHLEYYEILSANNGCSPANRDRFEFVKALMQKLSESYEHDPQRPHVLIVDPKRMAEAIDTGILVRALDPEGKPFDTDIAYLTKESLFAWLRSRGGNNPWAENTVAILLGYHNDETP